jgi:hypothetical protein
MSLPPLPNHDFPLRRPEHEDAARIATLWLEERHRKGWQNAFKSVLEDWRPGVFDDLWDLDEDELNMLSVNVGEWMVARGQIHARGGLREINAYLLGREGPYFTPAQQAWIAQLRERPLRLYRVTEVRPGEGLTLLDETDPAAEPLKVREISASRTAEPGMLLGTRIMQAGSGGAGEPGWLALSGAMYPFSKLGEATVLAQVRHIQDGADALSLQAGNARDLVETTIARCWLSQWFDPPPLPTMLDASTGEPLLFVTDYYRVLDQAALEAALSAQDDVVGDAESGWSRTRLGTDGMQRDLASIQPSGGSNADQIEVFYRTQGLADEGRTWFEALAGAAVQHLSRETIDPTERLGSGSGAKAGSNDPDDSTDAGAGPAPFLAPEDMAQAIEQYIHRYYANWCDDVIPALGGLTPRQAIGTAAGLERVKGLLREYESGERRQSEQQGRPAVSYQFLWDALGLSR